MEALYAVPLFFQCKLSVTGAGVEERQRLAHQIQTNGGTFTADLTSSCTHLLVMDDFSSGAHDALSKTSPKLVFSHKWNIPIVSVQWLRDCLCENILLDTTTERYRISYPPNAHGDSLVLANASPVFGSPPITLSEELTMEEITAALPLPPYLEGVHIYVGDQAPPARLQLLKRLILGAGGVRYADLFDRSLITHYLVHNQTLTGRDQELLRQWDKHGTNTNEYRPAIVHDQWLFACFQSKARVPIEPYLVSFELLASRGDSNSYSSPSALTGTSTETPKSTIWSLKANHSVGQQSTKIATTDTNVVSSHLPLFSGLSFKLHLAEDPIKISKLTELIEENGGAIASAEQLEADYSIAPIIITEKLPDINSISMLNEVWVEACVHEGHLLETKLPNLYYFHCLRGSSPSSSREGGFSSMKISVSGFVGWEREFLGRLITCLGASYSENLTKRNTHLISTQAAGPKFDFAQNSGIKCLQKEWLLESAKSGYPLSELDFSIRGDEGNGKENHGKSDQNYNKGNYGESEKENITVGSSIKRPLEDNKVILNAKKGREATFNPSFQNKPINNPMQETSEISTLFKGLVFAISPRIWHRRDEIHDLVMEMGGSFVWSYDCSCSHYIHQGNMLEETFREFRLVRQHKKFIISPWWLFRCKEAGRRVLEVDFPHTFSPNVQHPLDSIPMLRTSSTLPFSPLSLSSPIDPKPNISSNSGNADFSAILTAEEEKLKAKVPTVTFEMMPLIKKPLEAKPSDFKDEKVRVFAFSALNSEQRTRFPTKLSELGGTCLESAVSWDSRTTHLVIGALTKSEKLLCACASGRWVLRPEYVEACEAAGRLVEERPYEWTATWLESELSRAPRYWRETKKRAGGRGAFDGWKVLLVVDQKRQSSLKAVLMAGDAQVFEVSDGLDILLGMAEALTHVLISSSQIKGRIPQELQPHLTGKFHNVEIIADRLFNFDKT